MNPRDLRILNKGEHITAEHYAAVTRSARSQIALPNGAFDGDIVIGRTKPAAPKQVQVKATFNIPKGSIFELVSAVEGVEPPTFLVDTYNPSRAVHIYATNELNTIYADGYGIATIIGEYPVKVRVDAGGAIPDITTEFGLVGSTFAFDASGKGLVCLSVPDDRTYIEVVAAKEIGRAHV